MDGDRGAVLLTEAAAEGLIDFRTARPLEPRWWQHVRAMTEALDRRKRYQAHQARMAFHLALVANGSLTEKSFAEQQEAATEAYYDLLGAVRPWDGKSYKDRRKQEFVDYRQQYIDAFGVDPLDPAFKAWERQAVEDLAAAGPSERSEDEIMAERFAARLERERRGRRT